MGQAIDLPDPIEKKPAGGAAADDLLSQLAGDEIDRLLAEADVDVPAAPVQPTDETLESPISNKPNEAANEKVDAISDVLPETPADDPVDDAQAAADALVEKSLDDLFDKLTGDEAKPEPPAAEAPVKTPGSRRDAALKSVDTPEMSAELDALHAALESKAPKAGDVETPAVDSSADSELTDSMEIDHEAEKAADDAAEAAHDPSRITGSAPTEDEVEESQADVSKQIDELFASLGGVDEVSKKAADKAEQEEPVADAVDAAPSETVESETADPETAESESDSPSPADEPVDAKALDDSIASKAPALADEEESEPDEPVAAAAANPKAALTVAPPEEKAAAPVAAEPAPEPAPDIEVAESNGTAAVPLYLKPLVWLNLPFKFLSPNMRETLGRIAIITFINALAVLIYVLAFRK